MRSIALKPAKAASATGFRSRLGRQVGERLVDQRRRVLLVDRADDRDHQSVARDPAPGGVDEIGPLDPRERFERAVGRLAIGVMGKGLRFPVAVGESAGIVGDVAQAGVHVLAHPLERLLVESRRVDREPQKLGGAIEVLGQRAHPPAPMVAVAMERHLDRLLVERPVKGLRIEVSRALVEEPRHQRAKAGLVGRVLRRAAAHGEFERHQRHRIGADEP